jgi:hypothetical protein
MRVPGLISFIDHTVHGVVHIAGSCDSYRDQRLQVRRAVGEWARGGRRPVERPRLPLVEEWMQADRPRLEKATPDRATTQAD